MIKTGRLEQILYCKFFCMVHAAGLFSKLCNGYWVQVPRSRCSAHGRRSTQHPGGAHSVPDAAHCPTDCCWHGLPGLPALCPQRLGNTELPGRRKPAGQDRRLWHVQRCLQLRLLQSKDFRYFPLSSLTSLRLIIHKKCGTDQI